MSAVKPTPHFNTMHQPSPQRMCYRCGSTAYLANAYDIIKDKLCNNRGKFEHFSKVYRLKATGRSVTGQYIEEEHSDSDDELFFCVEINSFSIDITAK